MTRIVVSSFPELARVFSGYLHEDFVAEYGSPEAALRAFHEDASPVEWRRFQREAKRLAALIEARDLDEIRGVIQRLGSAWTPSSGSALATLLKDVARLKPPDGR